MERFQLGLLVILTLVLILLLKFIPKPDGGIPKIIHQTAPADRSKWHAIWTPCQKSWRTQFPDWEYKMWTDEDLEDLIKNKYSWFYPTWKGYDQKIKRIDSARYFIMYEYGGMYADMDFECVQNFEHKIPDGVVSIAESPWKHDGRGETYQNALMISPPKHEFWEIAFKKLEAAKNIPDVLYATGPQIIMQAIAECNPRSFNALPHNEFAPAYNGGDFRPVYESGRKTLLNAKANRWVYTRHHSTAVWGSGANQI